jgi:hypothetical protein
MGLEGWVLVMHFALVHNGLDVVLAPPHLHRARGMYALATLTGGGGGAAGGWCVRTRTTYTR